MLYSSYSSPLGMMTMACDGERLTGLWFDGQKYVPNTDTADFTDKEVPVLKDTKHWLDMYFSGLVPDFTPPLGLIGTPFRRAVWDILLTIPYGKTTAYGSIAKIIAEKTGKPKMSAQAVGGSVGHNPIVIIVPCHRVIGADGSLTGYAGGLNRKIKLLEIEATQTRLCKE